MFLISLSLSLSLSSIHRLLPSTTGVKGYHRYYQTTFPPFDKKSLLRNQFSDSGAFESLMAFDIFFFLFSFSFLSFFFSLLSAERIFFFAARRVYSRCNATWIRGDYSFRSISLLKRRRRSHGWNLPSRNMRRPYAYLMRCIVKVAI